VPRVRRDRPEAPRDARPLRSGCREKGGTQGTGSRFRGKRNKEAFLGHAMPRGVTAADLIAESEELAEII
jgi:hypothetical protein